MTDHCNDAITWFEIPVTDLPRAQHFYESMLSAALTPETAGPYRMAVLPYQSPGVGGCLVHGAGYRPSADGNVVYLNAAPNLDAALARAAQAGGTVALPKTALPGDMGFYAHVMDSEGNRIGLHAPA